jgi:hypothetical protein
LLNGAARRASPVRRAIQGVYFVEWPARRAIEGVCFLFKHNTTKNNMCYSTSMCGNMDLMVVNAMPNENKQTYTHPIKPAHQQIKSTSMQHIRALVAPS